MFKPTNKIISHMSFWLPVLFILSTISGSLFAQGVTTGAMNGLVMDNKGEPLPGANVVATHEPSGTQYGTAVRTGGAFNIPNMRIGGPYTVTVTFIGYKTQSEENVFVRLGQNVRLDFKMIEEAITMDAIQVVAEQDKVLNSGRTGAATYVDENQVTQMPSIKRSTRDLTRIDPRSDGNFSFGGRNWLYNNISVDGSYFNNPFGLDDPAPGGQSNAEPVPFDAVAEVQVSVAPFDVRQGGFTGANVNTVTKSGTNEFKASAYTFGRNESFIGNSVRGNKVIADPSLSFNQSGFTLSGPLIRDKLFFFVNGELERRDDPGTNFVANNDGTLEFGESRVRASDLDRISQVLRDNYNYETGPYQGFVHETNNNKLLLKLDWNINENNNLTFRYNFLDAERDLPPHPFAASFLGSGRGPNENSLPFQNSGYTINNELHSFALEVNSRGNRFANRFFASYNRFRDHRTPFSEDFPTIEIGEGGQTYTTVGHEPFSIHNILDQDVLQITNNFSLFSGKHVFTFGTTFESFSFFNSFNLFRHGVFLAPGDLDFLAPGAGFLDFIGATTFASLDNFLRRTDPNHPDYDPANRIDLRSFIGSGPFKGEEIDVGQLALYAQDEFLVSENFNLTYGLRVDFPMYFTDPVDNPFSRALNLLDENGNPETIDQSDLPDVKPLFSPRVGFNWDVKGDRSTQVRGGTGIFTGRPPFVWIGNNISNPGHNPNLFPGGEGTPGLALDEVPDSHKTSDDAILMQSFFLNAIDPDFKWPQIWTSNIAVDQKLPWDLLGTLEFLYSKDLNAPFIRNGDLGPKIRNLPGPDGRPFYGGVSLNPFAVVNGDTIPHSGGAYIIDSRSEGFNYSLTAQLRKEFDSGLSTTLAYTFTQAKSILKSTEIAFELWQQLPVQGNPNDIELGFSEFGQRHRIVGGATYSKKWSQSLTTHFGLFFEAAEGNRFAGAGGNRYSYTYVGDVNGDASPSNNDLIYIPRNQSEIILSETDSNGDFFKSVNEQWQALNSFIEQDNYLSSHRGQIAERFGGVNPWFTNIDLRILQDFSFTTGTRKHTFQANLDILNVANLLKSDWGVRKVAQGSATSPLRFVRFNNDGAPEFNYVGPENGKTFIDDPSQFSRWQIQLGVRYFFN
ncbi:MAG: carboxypeptidase regulatory-like domain-containing protein [bacterium]